MTLDKTSEIIAHFIGVFEQAEDGARLRDSAQGFDHSSRPDPSFDPLATIEYLLRAPYENEGCYDGLSNFQFPTNGAPFVPVASVLPLQTHGTMWLQSKISFAPDDFPSVKGGQVENGQSVITVSMTPGSTVVMGHQFNVLVDHDFLVGAGTMQFIAPEYFDAMLSSLTDVALGMSQDMIGNPLNIIPDAAGFGQALSAQYVSLAEDAPDAAQITVVSGNDAFGVTINGAASQEMPQLDDMMPAYLQAGPADEDSDVVAPPGVGGTAAAAGAVFDVDDGHSIVAGGNFTINEAIVSYSAVDAPVIAVMGDAICVVSISQINVIQNCVSDGLPMQPDVAVNAAKIAARTSQIDTETAQETENTPQDFPQGWAVTRVEGDLMTVNWAHQYTFISDHDRAEVTFSGEDSFIGLGANIAVNQTTLLEFGVGYDLIIVGGQMIDMALISQTNILLDTDAISHDGMWPATLSEGDNLTFNAASIDTLGIDSHIGMDSDFAQAGQDLASGSTTISADVAQSDYFAGNPYLNVLYIAGDLITVTAIAQTNIVGDADQISVELAELEAAADGPVTVTSGSNAVVNIASIMEYGMDSIVMVGGEVYDDVLLYQAELIETDADPLDVLQTPLANEAVAFLADDMADETPTTDGVFAGQIDTSTTSVDVMGSVVA